MISRLLGEGEKEGASQIGAISFWSALFILLLCLLLVFFLEPVMYCGASENTNFGKAI